MGEKRSAYRILVGILVGKPDGKRPLVWIGLVWLRIGTSGRFL
jgi:hypothetical protein